jgi:CRP/FNR family transcriptional regulator
MEKAGDLLGRTFLFKGLPPDQLGEIEQIAVRKDFSKGDFIFLDGDQGSGFYVVAEGQVKIFKISLEGKEQILHIFGPGEPFGEAAVFAGQRFPASAEAITASQVFFFPRSAFKELIGRNPSLAMNMLSVLSMRLKAFAAKIEDLSLKEAPARLADHLLLLSKEQDTPDEIILNISKGHLASLLGTIPETLSRILARMSNQGLIDVKGPRIRILDKVGLQNLSQQGDRLA